MSRPSIIAIAGSAGAIQPLHSVVSNLPHDFGVSMFVVVHRTSQDGLLTQVLSYKTGLQVVTAQHGALIAQRTIYVAPADFHLTVSSSHMFLSKGPKVNRHRVIGVLLSGYLDDGTAGLAAIKECGGIAIVQDPKDALVPNMPRSALLNVGVDYSLPAAEIAPLLVGLTGRDGTANHRSKAGSYGRESTSET